MFKTQLIGPFLLEEDTIHQDKILEMLKNGVYSKLRIGYRIWVSCLLTGDWTCAPFWTQSSPIVGSAEMGLHHGATFSGHNSTWLFSMGLCEDPGIHISCQWHRWTKTSNQKAFTHGYKWHAWSNLARTVFTLTDAKGKWWQTYWRLAANCNIYENSWNYLLCCYLFWNSHYFKQIYLCLCNFFVF